jgi:peptidoglycan/xylan/chitin deacetylase (PgdA/CDA1 family)
MNSKLKIYTYHYVQADRYSKFDKLKSLSTDNFIKQIEYLRETKHNFISLYDLNIKSQLGNPQNAVMLTFDDGLKSSFSTVFPILRDYGIPAVFFPSARPFLSKKAFDATKLHYVLASIDSPYSIFVVINSEFNMNLDGKMDECGKDNRFDNKVVATIKKYLQRDCPFLMRTKIVDYLFKLYVTKNEDEFVENVYMSPAEIEIMNSYDGCEFGGHGYLHEWMGKADKYRNMKEVLYSDRMLDKLDRNRIKSFSYPYGNYSNDTVEILEKRGYEFGFTAEPRMADLEKDHKLLLPRYDCNDLQKEMEDYYK